MSLLSVNDYVKSLAEEDGIKNYSQPTKQEIKVVDNFKEELRKCLIRKPIDNFNLSIGEKIRYFIKTVKKDIENNKPYNFKKIKLKKYCMVNYKNYEVHLTLLDRLKNLKNDIWESFKFYWVLKK